MAGSEEKREEEGKGGEARTVGQTHVDQLEPQPCIQFKFACNKSAVNTPGESSFIAGKSSSAMYNFSHKRCTDGNYRLRTQVGVLLCDKTFESNFSEIKFHLIFFSSSSLVNEDIVK